MARKWRIDRLRDPKSLLYGKPWDSLGVDSRKLFRSRNNLTAQRLPIAFMLILYSIESWLLIGLSRSRPMGHADTNLLHSPQDSVPSSTSSSCMHQGSYTYSDFLSHA